MAASIKKLDRWWRSSLLYSLLAGSFFLRWLVGTQNEPDIDCSDAWSIAAVNRIINPCLQFLYKLGDTFGTWLSSSWLVSHWLLFPGILILLFAVIVLRLTLSPGLALGIALIGIGLIFTRNLAALAAGSQLGRLTTWWLKD